MPRPSTPEVGDGSDNDPVFTAELQQGRLRRRRAAGTRSIVFTRPQTIVASFEWAHSTYSDLWIQCMTGLLFSLVCKVRCWTESGSKAIFIELAIFKLPKWDARDSSFENCDRCSFDFCTPAQKLCQNDGNLTFYWISHILCLDAEELFEQWRIHRAARREQGG